MENCTLAPVTLLAAVSCVWPTVRSRVCASFRTAPAKERPPTPYPNVMSGSTAQSRLGGSPLYNWHANALGNFAPSTCWDFHVHSVWVPVESRYIGPLRVASTTSRTVDGSE